LTSISVRNFRSIKAAEKIRLEALQAFVGENNCGKLRALLQRRRNRDLFDLHHGLEQLPLAPEKVIACFDHYLALEGKPNRRGSPPRRTWRSFAGVRGSRREVRPRFEDIDIS
jgi:hypothetical protein